MDDGTVALTATKVIFQLAVTVGVWVAVLGEFLRCSAERDREREREIGLLGHRGASQ